MQNLLYDLRMTEAGAVVVDAMVGSFSPVLDAPADIHCNKYFGNRAWLGRQLPGPAFSAPDTGCCRSSKGNTQTTLSGEDVANLRLGGYSPRFTFLRAALSEGRRCDRRSKDPRCRF